MKLIKMDSFLKESQRFNSTTLCKLPFIFGDTKLISASPYDAQGNAAIRILGWY
jgi:acyl CoA:acetate/3-ketoacid CoA transferase alpha subunit